MKNFLSYSQLALGKQNVQVMTFGEPRIGNAAFASYYSQVVPNTIRVTNGHDIVPHLPPYYHYFRQKTYHHFPREVMVLRNSKFIDTTNFVFSGMILVLKWCTYIMS